MVRQKGRPKKSMCLINKPQTRSETIKAIKSFEKPAEAPKTGKNDGKENKDEKIPDEIVQEFRRAQQRFMFNIDQIEQKYCQATTGLVLDVKKDEYIFDQELCTMPNDDTLIQKIQEQQKQHSDKSGKLFGSALLSTPAQDPDEEDKGLIKDWKELNKKFEEFYQQRLKEAALKKEEEEKEKRRRCTALVRYTAAPPPQIQAEPPPQIITEHFRAFIGMMEQKYGFRFSGNLDGLGDFQKMFQTAEIGGEKKRQLAIGEGSSGSSVKIEEIPVKKRKLEERVSCQSNSTFDDSEPCSSHASPIITIPETPVQQIRKWATQKPGRLTNEEIVAQTP